MISLAMVCRCGVRVWRQCGRGAGCWPGPPRTCGLLQLPPFFWNILVASQLVHSMLTFCETFTPGTSGLHCIKL